jgi:hypothetical protein
MKMPDNQGESSGGIDFYRFTALARPIEPKYTTNIIISVVAVIVTIVAAIIRYSLGSTWLQSIVGGVVSGLAVFLAWALCRELDPDHELSAFVAVGFAILGLIWGQPQLLPLFWLIVFMRIINRTTGLPATVLDSLVLMAISGWLVWGQGNWVYGIMAAIAFILDALLETRNQKQILFAGLAVLGTVLWIWLSGEWWRVTDTLALTSLPVALMSIIYIPVIVAYRNLDSVCDYDKKPLNPERVQASQIGALVFGLQVALWRGTEGIIIIMPFWAAVVGAGIYKLFNVRISRVTN